MKKWTSLILIGGAVAIVMLVMLAKITSVRQTPTNAGFTVSASFYPLAFFAQQVGGTQVTVKNLVPAGVEPHEYEPTPKDLIQLQKSPLLFYNGAGLEQWLPKFLSQFSSSLELVNTSEGISLISLAGDGQLQSTDPHVWLDPVLASAQVQNISNALQKKDPTHASEYASNSAQLQKKLGELDQEFKKALSQCQRHEVVTSHDALQYVAKRYGFQVKSIAGLSPEEEPSAQQLADVTKFVKNHQVKFIFFETMVSPKLAQTLAQETGAQAIAFNTIEGVSADELAQGVDYFSLQRDNMKALKVALECADE